MTFAAAYSNAIELKMRLVFQSMDEKDRRRFAGIEATKFGPGSTQYLTRVFGCSAELVQRGKSDVEALPHDPAGNRVRRPGGGRKTHEQKHPEVTERIQEILQDRTAGDPMNPKATFTDKTPAQISRQLADCGNKTSPNIVRRVLKRLGFGLRKIVKSKTRASVEGRNEQFEYISHLKERCITSGNPVFSIDTKKKEPLGLLHRAGRVYCQKAIKAWDHDFANWAEGMVVPHGIYDIQRNEGWLNLGISRDKRVCH